MTDTEFRQTMASAVDEVASETRLDIELSIDAGTPNIRMYGPEVAACHLYDTADRPCPIADTNSGQPIGMAYIVYLPDATESLSFDFLGRDSGIRTETVQSTIAGWLRKTARSAISSVPEVAFRAVDALRKEADARTALRDELRALRERFEDFADACLATDPDRASRCARELAGDIGRIASERFHGPTV